MKRMICMLLFIFPVLSQAAVYTSSVFMQPGNYPTITWFSAQGTAPSGDLYAQGMRYFGLASRVTKLQDGSPHPSPNYVAMIKNGVVPLAPGDTWYDAVQKFINRYGASGAITSTFNITDYYSYEACIAASYCEYCGSQGSQNIIYPGSCSTIDFTNTVCTIDSLGVLEHGAMNTNEVNGHRAAMNATISCNSPVLVRLRVLSSNLPLGNGVSSDLYIDGASTGITSGTIQYYLNGPRTIKIESVLSSSFPQSGTFSGSSYVIIEVL